MAVNTNPTAFWAAKSSGTFFHALPQYKRNLCTFLHANLSLRFRFQSICRENANDFMKIRIQSQVHNVSRTTKSYANVNSMEYLSLFVFIRRIGC